ncbi:P-loop containing nucleoside triphosphate hydrolase protein [Lentinula edodes]|uniref:P-loop containing nucleoside triphosphate hydrolase protein n=1 Tax=Lentinula lateritia TaxID=40482 RepID=A0A9W9E012_9AGAR|nr:P-loop containing nucleoside triphosphate hydrolase protein [Lentinula edodes]
MPRIRKKTSKRGSTNDRKKISQKVRESRKKKTKAAKKSVEWKSKHKKDPGIPNTFPYKDQILAEVAEQHRKLKLIEKQHRKDEKKRALTHVAEDVQDDGIASISAKRKPVPEVEESEDEDEPPILINRDLPHLHAVLDEADAVIQVLDARDPLSFRNSYLEDLVHSKPGRKTLFVLNKIAKTSVENGFTDCVPHESLVAWTSALRKQQPTFPFRSASSFLPGNPLAQLNTKGKGRAKNPVDDALGGDAILECLSHWAAEKENGSSLTVAVVGVTNTGKSSLINSLAETTVLPVYSLASSPRGPTTTTMPQEITIQVAGNRTLRVIDTPGYSWKIDKASSDWDEVRARDILLRNKGRIDRLKDPSGPVTHLVSRANPEDLMLLYGLPTFPKGDVNAFVSGIARSQQLVRKRGVLHLTGALKVVLRDWCIGKIHWYSMPSSNLVVDTPSTNARLQALYAKADEALASLKSRKAMRKAGGLVKISPGQVESREVISEVPYAELMETSDGEDNDGIDVDEADHIEAEEDEDEESEEDEEDGDKEEVENEEELEFEDEEVEVAPPASKSQKRKRADPISHPPNKKVSFVAKSHASKNKAISKADVSAVSESSAQKSLSTDPTTRKALKSSLKKMKPIANASSKNRPPKIRSDEGNRESYDFGKYF